MKKLTLALLCCLSAAAIGLSTWSLVRSYTTEQLKTEYTMYVGTNDKDTYELVMPVEEARAVVHNTMMNHFADGFTMYEAKGVWRDEKKVITLEYTFVCIVEEANKTELYKAADELIVALNQSTILIVASAAHAIDFYTGAK